MSRPSGLRSTSSPFVRQKKKSGSQKLGLNMDKIDVSYNHNYNAQDNIDSLRSLRTQLAQAEQEGRYSKAKKLRRLINEELEVGIYLVHSWCFGCNNVLHKCQCQQKG